VKFSELLIQLQLYLDQSLNVVIGFSSCSTAVVKDRFKLQGIYVVPSAKSAFGVLHSFVRIDQTSFIFQFSVSFIFFILVLSVEQWTITWKLTSLKDAL
jgi:hypothetical protein